MDRIEKIKKYVKSPYGVGVAFLIFTFSVYLYFHQSGLNALIEQAASNYLQGEQAVSKYDREQAFNAALEQYLSMEKKYDPTYGTGKLYFNIASTLFQLEEYPQAILYNYKTLKLNPSDQKALENLEIIWNRIGLPPVVEERNAFDLIFLEGTLSLPRKIQLFSLFFLITCGVLSWAFWKPSSLNKVVAPIFGTVACYFLSSVFYAQFIVPVEGVILSASPLYRDAGTQYAKVVEEPVVSGSKVKIFDITPNGEWAKIMTPNGNLGYVLFEKMRVI